MLMVESMVREPGDGFHANVNARRRTWGDDSQLSEHFALAMARCLCHVSLFMSMQGTGVTIIAEIMIGYVSLGACTS